jgi:hypothetical protein
MVGVALNGIGLQSEFLSFLARTPRRNLSQACQRTKHATHIQTKVSSAGLVLLVLGHGQLYALNMLILLRHFAKMEVRADKYLPFRLLLSWIRSFFGRRE